VKFQLFDDALLCILALDRLKVRRISTTTTTTTTTKNHFTSLLILSGTIRMSQYQKDKTKANMDFLEQQTAGLYANLQLAPNR